jgi:hypothetical protein
MNSTTIEQKYGVEQGDDWLAVAMAAQYKRGQRVTFVQGSTRNTGKVIDTRRTLCFGQLTWMFLVKHEGKNIPRWTLEKWLVKAEEYKDASDKKPICVLCGSELRTVNGDEYCPICGELDEAYKEKVNANEQATHTTQGQRMTEQEKNQLVVALEIFSGRTDPSELDDGKMSLLGYDIRKFQFYGKPSPHEVRLMCEDTVFCLIARSLGADTVNN